MSLVTGTQEALLFRALANVPQADSNAPLVNALKHIQETLRHYFNCEISIWLGRNSENDKDHARPIEAPHPACGRLIDIDPNARLYKAKHALILEPTGRWLLLHATLNSREGGEINYYFCTSPLAYRYASHFLELLANQIQVVLVGALQSEHLLRRAQLLELLSSATQVALEGEELDQVLKQIVSFLRSRFELLLVSIHMLDLERDSLVLRAFSARDDVVHRVRMEVGNSWQVGRGICGRTMRHGEMQLVRDVSADSDYVSFCDDVRSELALPIIRCGQSLGVLNLESDDRYAFDGDVVLMLRSVTDQLAGAINLAVVNGKLQNALHQVEAREIHLQRSNVKLRRSNENLRRLSMLDGLTGVANRRGLEYALKQCWKASMRDEESVALIMTDLDHFKVFNDELGHLAGDDALRSVAHRLNRSLRDEDDGLIARFGGEEFAVLLPRVNLRTAEMIAQRQRSIVQNLNLRTSLGPLTMSAGVACLQVCADVKPEDLIQLADTALYRAKSLGRNCVQLYTA
jgi:diguanylate cyclase (GGDEF)-like protein